MASISKRVNGSWVSGDERVMKTATDTITTLPADLYADGTAATIGLKGNMSQTGTPTPQNPIQPQETGERTGNLFNVDGHDTTNGYINSYRLNSDGTTQYSGTMEVSEYIAIDADTQYTVNGLGSYNAPSMCFYDSDKQFISGISYNGRSKITFTTPSTAVYMRFTHIKVYTQAMLVKDADVPAPFEPYGIKIPISSANTTTNVYLGEVESTRRIKKYEVTGQENWDVNPSSNVFFANIDGALGAVGVVTAICSHYNAVENKTLYNQVPNNSMCIRANASILWIKDTDYDSGSYYTAIEDFKAYLAAQYAAGTPVTVWYVLAESETGIVNEPLRKIGEYADTVSGITIPTIAGADSFDVLTTLKPSEVTVNYHGWHTGTVHERENGEWT